MNDSVALCQPKKSENDCICLSEERKGPRLGTKPVSQSLRNLSKQDQALKYLECIEISKKKKMLQRKNQKQN